MVLYVCYQLKEYCKCNKLLKFLCEILVTTYVVLLMSQHNVLENFLAAVVLCVYAQIKL